MTDQELMEQLATTAAQSLSNVKTLNGTAVLQLRNTCFPEWNVVVAAAGVNFYYEDGTSDVDGPRPIQLTAGQSALFSSKKPNGCVKRMFLAATVVIPNEPTKQLTENITDVGPNECMSSRGRAVGPNNSYVFGEGGPGLVLKSF